jgi:hypothetical protein
LFETSKSYPDDCRGTYQEFPNLKFSRIHTAKPGRRATRPDNQSVDNQEEALEAERRQHPRFRVREGAFEVFSRDSKMIGKLSNISLGGLAFQYSPVGGQKAESETIDIMAKSPDLLYLPSVACRTMYDISALAEDQTFTGAATRLCGVKFFRPTKEHKQKLALFIKKYGLMPSKDFG